MNPRSFCGASLIIKKRALLSSLLLAIGVSVEAQNTTYDWTGGASGFSGAIILDSPSSKGGSLSDIVSVTITTPHFGTMYMSLKPGEVFLTDPKFTWNSTQITEMFIGAKSTRTFDNMFVTENSGGGNDLTAYSILYDTTSIDTSGSWLVAPGTTVPDAGNSVWLLGLAVAGLGVLSRFRR